MCDFIFVTRQIMCVFGFKNYKHFSKKTITDITIVIITVIDVN